MYNYIFKRHITYTTNNQKGTIQIIDDTIKLPKVGKIKAKIHKKPKEDSIIKSATLSQERDGTYYISVLFEYDEVIEKVEITDKILGLDYKSDGFYTDSEGNICGSPKYYRKSQSKLKRLQKQLSKKGKDSKNREKARLKVAKLQRHIANQRLDFLQKESTRIANLYDIVCVESLDMKAMSNNGFKNGKATLDNGYGMFLNMLEYKLQDRGKYFVKVDKWYASSQICSKCGNKKKIALNEKIVGKGGIENSYMQILTEAIAFFLPLAIIQPLEIIAGKYIAWGTMFTTGVIFIVTHKLWLNNIYRRMMKRKYKNLEAFINS